MFEVETTDKIASQEVKQTVPLQKVLSKQVSGAEAIILSLLAEGVDTIFGYPGGAIMPFYDALYGYEAQLKHFLVRHEQGAIHAAQGYARMQSKAGVCVATSGPGATNLITGLADAMIDSTPLVCITGQVSSQFLGTDAFQETDVIGISMPVTKWNYQITKAQEIPEILAKAFYIAQSGRPGPVLIDISKDAQFNSLDFNYQKCTNIRSYKPKPKINPSKIEAAAKLINEAKKPFLLVGQGILLAKAENELENFLQKTGIPVASTLLGLSAVSVNHPNYVGYLGMHGNYAPNLMTNECDVLIALGMRFDDRVTGNLNTYAKQAKVIHIEIDPAEIDKNVKTTVAVLGDAKEVLQMLTPLLNENNYASWFDQFKQLDILEQEKVIQKDFEPNTEQLKMAEVIKMLSEKTKGQAVIVTDVGQHQMVTTRYYQFQKNNSNVTSGGLGTMGFALPAGMGAKIGAPHREVIAIIGDGGFQMTLQELACIAQYQIPLKIIVLNNNFLGMVRQWQELFFEKRYSFTELKNPDFVALVKAFGIDAAKVEFREDLDKNLDTLLNADKPFFLEIVVEKEENVFPMVPSGSGVGEMRLE